MNYHHAIYGPHLVPEQFNSRHWRYGIQFPEFPRHSSQRVHNVHTTIFFRASSVHELVVTTHYRNRSPNRRGAILALFTALRVRNIEADEACYDHSFLAYRFTRFEFITFWGSPERSHVYEEYGTLHAPVFKYRSLLLFCLFVRSANAASNVGRMRDMIVDVSPLSQHPPLFSSRLSSALFSLSATPTSRAVSSCHHSHLSFFRKVQSPSRESPTISPFADSSVFSSHL